MAFGIAPPSDPNEETVEVEQDVMQFESAVSNDAMSDLVSNQAYLTNN